MDLDFFVIFSIRGCIHVSFARTLKYLSAWSFFKIYRNNGMIEGILIGLETAFSLKNLMMVMIGCFAGTIIGMLPGLGPMTAIS